MSATVSIAIWIFSNVSSSVQRNSRSFASNLSCIFFLLSESMHPTSDSTSDSVSCGDVVPAMEKSLFSGSTSEGYASNTDLVDSDCTDAGFRIRLDARVVTEEDVAMGFVVLSDLGRFFSTEK